MTTESGGVTTIKMLAPGPAEMIMHLFTTTDVTDNDVVTIPDVTYVHYATAVSNGTSLGGAAALANEEVTIETATKLDEVLFQGGGDESLTGFSISDIDKADDITGAGTAATGAIYYRLSPGPTEGKYASSNDGGMIMAYFEGTVTTNEAISFAKVGIDKVAGAIAFSVSSRAFTVTECTIGDSDELHKIKFTTGGLSDSDVRGIVWGWSDDAAKAANDGATLTEATPVYIWKVFPGPSEINMRFFQNTEVGTNEKITIPGITEARFAIAHKVDAGITTINAVTVPALALGNDEDNAIKFTTTNSPDVEIRGIVIGDVNPDTAGWSS